MDIQHILKDYLSYLKMDLTCSPLGTGPQNPKHAVLKEKIEEVSQLLARPSFVLPDDIRESIEAILLELWQDEIEDYVENEASIEFDNCTEPDEQMAIAAGEAKPAGHIFPHMAKVDGWLNIGPPVDHLDSDTDSDDGCVIVYGPSPQ